MSLILFTNFSFLHHFYPAYDSTIANYAAKVTKKDSKKSSSESKKEITGPDSSQKKTVKVKPPLTSSTVNETSSWKAKTAEV
jgi:hypothetical protein